MFPYIGGKYRQSKWISSYIPTNTKKYSEVFGGAMWVYIKGNIYPEKAYYNDYNQQMANIFTCFSLHEKFLPYLESKITQDESLFYRYRDEIVKFMESNEKIEIPDFEMASKYIYLVTQCFSGIISKNVKFINLGTGFSAKYKSTIKRLKNPDIQKKLEKLSVSNMSYEDFIPRIDSNDMVMYLDPPYYGTENLYAFHNFTKEDHENLASILRGCKSKWILSYYEFPEMREWYSKKEYFWYFKDYKKASAAAKNKKQSTGTEVLITNFQNNDNMKNYLEQNFF